MRIYLIGGSCPDVGVVGEETLEDLRTSVKQSKCQVTGNPQAGRAKPLHKNRKYTLFQTLSISRWRLVASHGRKALLNNC